MLTANRMFDVVEVSSYKTTNVHCVIFERPEVACGLISGYADNDITARLAVMYQLQAAVASIVHTLTFNANLFSVCHRLAEIPMAHSLLI